MIWKFPNILGYVSTTNLIWCSDDTLKAPNTLELANGAGKLFRACFSSSQNPRHFLWHPKQLCNEKRAFLWT